ncbi:MAG TPA: invasin domain 3-containing protein, partial [Gemmata sp.]|nr:invasin domain 3-containing protein [Gemmata sp.]
PGSLALGKTIAVFLQTRDAAGNNLTTDLLGSETISFALANSTGGKGTFSPATYMGNGEYEATFTATKAGSNLVVALIEGSKVTSKAPAIEVT